MPAEACQRLARQLEAYRQRHRGVRWTPPATWHLTLLFLGSVDPVRVPELRKLIDDVARDRDAYRVRVDRADGRVRRSDSVAWLGLGEGASRLIALADALAGACPAGITRDAAAKRTRSAHLTVARKATAAVIDDLRTQQHGPIEVAWTVDRMVLVRSHLAPHGASYETLHERAL